VKLAAALLLCACATAAADDRRELGRAALAEAYVRQMCPALELDGGAP
jgi:hypothetical protein